MTTTPQELEGMFVPMPVCNAGLCPLPYKLASAKSF
jgi:hypothetical protein